MIYTQNDVEALKILFGKVESIKYFRVYLSTLGGENNASLMISLSLDASEDWPHKIFENSRHARFSVTSGQHKLEQFQGLYRQAKKRFRKCKAETVEQIAEKIQAWAEANA